MKPHKHAEVIKAWADGAAIEVKGEFTDYQWWTFQADYVPSWSIKNEYRIKPDPKPDIVMYGGINSIGEIIPGAAFGACNQHSRNNLKLTWDGETYKLKAAEVLE